MVLTFTLKTIGLTLIIESNKEKEIMCSSVHTKTPWEMCIYKVCDMDKDDHCVLLCDSKHHHTYCLNPPLVRLPEENRYFP